MSGPVGTRSRSREVLRSRARAARRSVSVMLLLPALIVLGTWLARKPAPAVASPGETERIGASGKSGEARPDLIAQADDVKPDPGDTTSSADSVGAGAPGLPAVRSPADSAGRSLPPLIAPRRFGSFVPEALAVDAFGRVFALDRGAGRILCFDPDGAVTAFGASDQGSDHTPILTGIFAGRGPDVYAIDAAEGLLYRFDLDGRLRARVSYADGLAEAGLTPGRAADFTLGNAGELYVLDRIGGRLLLFDRDGRFVTDLFAGLTGDRRPRAPGRLALTDDGSLFVLDTADSRIRAYSREGAPQADWSGLDAEEAGAEPPGLLAVTASGRAVLVSRREGRIWVRDRRGRLLEEDRIRPVPVSPLTDLKVMGDTLLLLASPGEGKILRRRLDALDHAPAAAPH